MKMRMPGALKHEHIYLFYYSCTTVLPSVGTQDSSHQLIHQFGCANLPGQVQLAFFSHSLW
jgi:hypothetical protein